MVHPGGQLLPAQGLDAPPVGKCPVCVERKIMKKEAGEGLMVALAEAAQPGRHYPNPWISEGGKWYSP